MKNFLYISLIIFTLLSCKKSETTQQSERKAEIETYATGQAKIYVEESVFPVFDDLNKVFTSNYPKADLQGIAQTENRIISLLMKDSIRLAFLPKKLSDDELNHFSTNIIAKQTLLGRDAILFIANKENPDSTINHKEVIELLKDSTKTTDKIFVFENVNSNLSNAFRKEAGITGTTKNVYFLPSTTEVIEYISKNKRAIGIIGVNWITQPDERILELKSELKSLAVYNEKDQKYYQGTQSNISKGAYPLIREIYVIDIQGKQGLGKGFSSFAAGPIGQRILLKSGLMPERMPVREINIVEE